MATTADELREEVRRRYAESAVAVGAFAASALRVADEASGRGCGSGSCCADDASNATKFGEALYDAEQRGELPDAAVLASLGCGNPTAVADLHEGETVLDLGSGGGIDVILSAKRVGANGLAYGLDMTDEMLALARRNAEEAGTRNAIFLKGLIEEIPLPAEAVDVVISNCVINLSTDKAAVLTEIARVLKRGGRVGVSDIVAEDRLSPPERAERGSHVGCIAGALSESEYRAGLDAAGFENIEVTFTHEVADGLHGAIVKAVKTSEPKKQGLPVIQPAVTAGCCQVGASPGDHDQVDQPEVLFVCVHNAGRSQMAAGLLKLRSDGRIQVRSAGSAPGEAINPAVIEAMEELGLDLSDEFPKPLTDEFVQAADVVITMGCGDACPIYPGKRYEDWELDDPAGQDVATVRVIRDEIDQRVQRLIAELLPAE